MIYIYIYIGVQQSRCGVWLCMRQGLLGRFCVGNAGCGYLSLLAGICIRSMSGKSRPPDVRARRSAYESHPKSAALAEGRRSACVAMKSAERALLGASSQETSASLAPTGIYRESLALSLSLSSLPWKHGQRSLTCVQVCLCVCVCVIVC